MKNRLFNIKLAQVQKVLYASNKKEALDKFIEYLKEFINKVNNIQDLKEILNLVLSDNFEFEEIKLSLVGIAYYKINERVLWHNEPGYIHSYSKTFLGKRYGYQINYNIQLDNGTLIDNSRFDEIVNADTLEPNIQGFKIL